MRELTTIGDMYATFGSGRRTLRTVERTARLRGMGWIGQTSKTYVAPTPAQLLAEPPGDALASATSTMLQHFEAAGVPSEHTSDPVVEAWQVAYNADPASWAQAHKLGVDGGYGPNSEAGADAIATATGAGTAPPVNTTTVPVPYSAQQAAGATSLLTIPTIVVTGKPTTPTKPAAAPAEAPESHTALKWILGLLAAGGLAFGASRMMKKRRRRGRRRAAPPGAIVLT